MQQNDYATWHMYPYLKFARLRGVDHCMDSCFWNSEHSSWFSIWAQTCNCFSIYLHYHTGQCKSTGGCYNELMVAYFGTGGGVKWRKR